VPAVPGIPNSDVIHFVLPSNSELFKATLVVQHHPVTIHIGMLDAIALDPGLEHGLGLSVVSHGNNVQRFYCTV
jgi:hypothetical protein